VLAPAESYSYLRRPVAEVYAQIIKDLTEAASKLPISSTGTDIGRATQGAAKGLLGKVYLTRKSYAEAARVLKEVIDAGTYQLLQNYADLFRDANAHNRESIFEVAYKSNSQGRGNTFATLFAPRTGGVAVTGQGASQGYNRPTRDMITAYEAGDSRKPASLAESWMNGSTVVNDPYVRKYMTQLQSPNDGDANWIVLRYADVLLMYAEALNEQNQSAQALPFLNQVRKRAGLADVTASGQTALRTALENERRVELAFEGHRWFDLLRTGRALEVMREKGKTVSDKDLLFPIPQQQRDINPALTQNPGY
jgi:hypothetical protein